MKIGSSSTASGGRGGSMSQGIRSPPLEIRGGTCHDELKRSPNADRRTGFQRSPSLPEGDEQEEDRGTEADLGYRVRLRRDRWTSTRLLRSGCAHLDLRGGEAHHSSIAR